MKKLISIILTIVCLLCFIGCEDVEKTEDSFGKMPKEMPDDFSFSLTWGCYGISSYDSATGKLVKTTDATNPEDYVTYYELSDDEKQLIYDKIRSLNPKSYPDEYDPHFNESSSPSMTLILCVNVSGKQKTIKAEDIAYSYSSVKIKGQKFLTACKDISDLLKDTDEWKALPDYEFYYD